ncbi:MAG: right-handed parallel beta-helix repeat-containing protein [Phycisphaerae bacterium]
MCLVTPAPGQTTWHVDDDNCPGPGSGTAIDPFCTIQEGITAAVDADTVLVADGTYTGPGNRNLNFAGRLITLRSTNGPGACTIDCQNSGRGFVFQNGETAEAVVDGFTITRGRPSGQIAVGNGGGMLITNNSNPTILHCRFVQNGAFGIAAGETGLGGAVFCAASSPTIIASTFAHNTATGGSVSNTGHGGGIYCLSGSPAIIDCTFSENKAGLSVGGLSNGFGGGACLRFSRATFLGCTFAGNAALGGAGVAAMDETGPRSRFIDCTFNANRSATEPGGALLAIHSAPDLIHCTFIGNVAGGDASGGAVAILYGDDATITGCTFVGNSAGRFGGAMLIAGTVNAEVTNCLFIGNTVPISGAGIAWFSGAPGLSVTPTLANCTLTQNTAGVSGGGIYSTDAYGGHTAATVSNCCVRVNSPGQIADDAGAETSVHFSNVQSGWSGAGSNNIDVNPVFIEMPGAGSDGAWGTNDDNHGDLRLSFGSPCIDAGDNTAVPLDTADLDGDGNTTERIPLDLDGNPRFVDDPSTEPDTGIPDPPDYLEVVDMGAFEFEPTPCIPDAVCDDLDLCTIDACGADSFCIGQPIHFGDVNNDGFANADDVNCLLDDIGGYLESLACCDRMTGTCSGQGDTLPTVAFQALDLAPCLGCPQVSFNPDVFNCSVDCSATPCPAGMVCITRESGTLVCRDPDNMGDGFTNSDDVNAILDSINGGLGNDNAMALCLGCVTPPASAPNDRWETPAPSVGEATLTLIPSKRAVDAGGEVIVDVYIDAAADLRTFQVTLDGTGGRRGALTVESVTIDDRRKDYVFGNRPTVSTTGAVNRVMLATLPTGGVTVPHQAYLGTYVLRASDNATGVFSVKIDDHGRTLLRTSQSEVIAVDASSITLAIAPPSR